MTIVIEQGSVPLTNTKREQYSKLRGLRNVKPMEAYLKAFSTSNKMNARKRAWELEKKPDVVERLQWCSNQLTETLTEVHETRKDFVNSELEDLYKEARIEGDRTIAVACLKLIGTEEGMFVQKRQTLEAKVDLNTLDAGEKLRMLQARFDRLGVKNAGELADRLGDRSSDRANGSSGMVEADDIQPLSEANGISQSG